MLEYPSTKNLLGYKNPLDQTKAQMNETTQITKDRDTMVDTVQTTAAIHTKPPRGASVFVGLSGGVDSALAAALLVEAGYQVTGIYMKNWSQDLPGFVCPWANDLADAERIAYKLHIKLDVWDCEKDYKSTVVDYLLDAYAKGLTPNPDVMCNQTIKFGTFLDRALAGGADYIATGHYAQLSTTTPSIQQTNSKHTTDKQQAYTEQTSGIQQIDQELPKLLRAADEHKDQTYFLWRVSAERLQHVLFPIGAIASKQEVRRLCAERKLGIEHKPDSDGICFIGPVGLRTFLLQTLSRKVGPIVEWETGKILGQHDGAFLFTVGQRKGLDLGGGPARYVVATDVVQNCVFVSAYKHCDALVLKDLTLADCCWVAGMPPAPGTYELRHRHTGALAAAKLEILDNTHAKIHYLADHEAVAPGQSVVVYDQTCCLGGGIVQPRPLPQRLCAIC